MILFRIIIGRQVKDGYRVEYQFDLRTSSASLPFKRQQQCLGLLHSCPDPVHKGTNPDGQSLTVSNENNIPFKYIGPRIMKGLKYPIKLFHIKKPYNSILNPKQRSFNFLKEITPTTFKILFLFMLMILFFAIIMFSVKMF